MTLLLVAAEVSAAGSLCDAVAVTSAVSDHLFAVTGAPSQCRLRTGPVLQSCRLCR